MSEISDSLIKYVQIISDNSVSKASTTVTVKAEITEIVSLTQGIYKAKYLNDSLTVYATQELEYSVGSIVYILIPDGNFSNKKLILGSAGTEGLTPIQEGAAAADKYYDISDNLIDNTITGELCSYESKTVTLTLDKERINEYFKQYSSFSFGVTIQTLLDITQKTAKGNYSIQLIIPFVGVNDSSFKYKKVIEINNFNVLGKPYGLEIPTPQMVNFTIDSSQLQLDMDSDIELVYFSDATFAQEENKKPDIFLTNFIFKAVGEIPQSEQQGYNMTLTATEGTIYIKGSDTKTITPTLRYNGKEIELSTKALCYWFEQDYSVGINSEDYIVTAGAGWKCLNRIDAEGNPVSLDSIVVNKKSDVSEITYKCVIIYDKAIITKNITLINPLATVKLEIGTTDGNTVYQEGVGHIQFYMKVLNLTKNENLTYNWVRKDKNETLYENSDLKIIEEEEVTEEEIVDGIKYYHKTFTVELSKLLIDELTTVSCTVIKEDKTVLGTKSITVSIGEVISSHRLIINGDNKIYKYDANGNSPMVANYDGPISSIISELEPLSYQIFKEDGSELTDKEYALCNYTWKIPKNSLIQLEDIDELINDDNYYYIKGNGNADNIFYSIANKFNYNKTDNTILLEVAFDNKVLSNKINIFFLKDGASGTNGTKYAAVVTYDKFGYAQKDDSGRIQKLRVFCYQIEEDKYEWYYYSIKNNAIIKFEDGLPSFNVSVYEDANILKEDQYKVSYSWFGEKPGTEEKCLRIENSAIGSINEPTNNDKILETINIIQANITITANGNTNAIGNNTTLYAYYPIEITITAVKPTVDNMVSIDDGFYEVVYEDNETNPKYDSSSPFKYSGVAEDAIVDWRCLGHLQDRSPQDDYSRYHKYVPDNVYGDGNSYNCIIASTENFLTMRPIVFIYNRYGMSNINGWDGNKLYTGADKENEEFLFAPQVGAGKKETDNSFTGMVMGTRNRDSEIEVGLFGYYKGKQSFFLDAENGSASFGVLGEGQIEIIPNENKAIIQSGNFSIENKIGMQIDLTTPSIRWGNGNFLVDENGYGTLKGGGSIGGWKIGDDTLSSGNVVFKNTGDLSGKNWYINNDGSAKFGNLSISNTGSITADGGKFNSIEVDGNSVFKGQLSGASGDFSGTITAIEGKIAGWRVSGNSLIAESAESATEKFLVKLNGPTKLGTEGEPAADVLVMRTGAGTTTNPYTYPIVLSSNGRFRVTNIIAEGGTIGGWNIGKETLPLPGGEVFSGQCLYIAGSVSTTYLLPNGIAVKNNSGRVAYRSWIDIMSQTA